MAAGDVGETSRDEQADTDPLATPRHEQHGQQGAEGGQQAGHDDQPHRAAQRSSGVAFRQQPGDGEAEQPRGHRQPGHRWVGVELPVEQGQDRLRQVEGQEGAGAEQEVGQRVDL